MKPKIKEMIVVEGKNDTQALQRVFDCDTIETHGLQLSRSTLDFIKEAAKVRGILIFTDPDSPGEAIRRKIMQEVPEARHVFIEKKKARTDKKVGVEHASETDLLSALGHAVTFVADRQTLSWPEYLDLGLVGNKARREALCAVVHIGPCNAKTCFKRLNQLGLDAESLERILHDCA